jgi:hypothetical protein
MSSAHNDRELLRMQLIGKDQEQLRKDKGACVSISSLSPTEIPKIPAN